MLHCISKLAEKDYHTTDISYNPYLKGLSLTGKVLKREEENEIRLFVAAIYLRYNQSEYSYIFLFLLADLIISLISLSS